MRQGIHWQNIPPVNGREFTASDEVYHYDRCLGLGAGFTTVSPFMGGASQYAPLKTVTATDKYTVVFKWSIANPEYINEIMEAVGGLMGTEAPEVIQQWGNMNDWHHAIGTGSFMITDFVDGSSATLVKNPNYWGYDERYPQNKLPYVDGLKYLIIPDQATALSALRTGKIDIMDLMPLQVAQSMQKTNPEILQIAVPMSTCLTIDPRNDVKPFNDIRVRQAMQMAIDLPTIASTYYGGSAPPYPSSLTSNYMTGYGFPYSQWPQSLKDEYAYNPTTAKQLLAAAGYPNGFNTDAVADSSGDLDLLQVVKAYFAAVGINMDIRTMDPTSWVSFVQIGHKADQLIVRANSGELGSTGAPVAQFPKYQTGASTNWMMISDPVYDAFIPASMAASTVDAYKQVLTDANKYITQHHFVISLLEPSVFALYQPWLKGYNAQSKAVNDAASPNLVSFYAARFWIDQNMKTSMGH